MTDPAPQHGPDSPDTSAASATTESSSLRSHLTRESTTSRRELAPVPGVTRSDYQQLLAMVRDAERRVSRAGIEIPPDRGRLVRHRRLLEDVVRSIEDPDAESLAMSESDVYLAALEVGQLAQIVSTLTHPGSRWSERILAVLHPEHAASGSVETEDQRFRLHFMAICRQAGFSPRPIDSRETRAEPSMGPDALFELSRWRLGLACQLVGDDRSLESAIGASSARLRSARVPGLIALEVTRLIWPERRVLRVDSDTTASHELQRRTDHFLTEQSKRIGANADAGHAFGVLAVATLPTFNVSTRHISFGTTFRIASLVDAHDPRYAKLAEFARRFQRAGT